MSLVTLIRKKGPTVREQIVNAKALLELPEYQEAQKRPSTMVKRKKHHPRQRRKKNGR